MRCFPGLHPVWNEDQATGAVIYKRGIDFSGDQVFKGERVHAYWTLPEEAVLKRAAKVVLEKK